MKHSFLLKILPPIWFFLFLAAALCLHFYVPALRVFDINELAGKVIGIFLFFLGMRFSLVASKLFREKGTEILPTSPSNKVLVTDGPYQATRNPMYLGMILTLLGIAFYVGTLPVFLAAIAQFLILNFVFIPFEEEKMARLFGEDFAEYKKMVRRWV